MMSQEGATGGSLARRFRREAERPRAVWMMLPAAFVDQTIDAPHAAARARRHPDRRRQLVLQDDIRRAERAAPKGIHYLDVGTSGGIWGLERGYCLMIGGERPTVQPRADLRDAGAGRGGGPRTPGRDKAGRHRRARLSALRARRCRPLRQDGPQRHRVRPDGRRSPRASNILHNANVGKRDARGRRRDDAAPQPEHYQYDFDLATSPRSGGAAAWSLVAARPDGAGARREPDALELHRPRGGLGRGPLDAGRRDRRVGAGAGADARRCSPGSARAASPRSRTGCSRRCATSSAGTTSGGLGPDTVAAELTGDGYTVWTG